MNAAIDYIEDNLTGEIDYKLAAKAACCPNYHFQRMFALISEVTLAEYIRRRRLTLAAFELQQSNKSVIEIAQTYGYQSHASFTRAFRELHGIAPSSTRKSGVNLKAFPRMSFHITIKGRTEMNYRIEKIPGFSAAGFKNCVNTASALHSIPKLWQEARMNGMGDKLLGLMGGHFIRRRLG
jgi:AraC family transcriptional regulator